MALALGLALLASIELPPIQYRENNGAKIVFATPGEIQQRCMNQRALACTIKVGEDWVIYMPNPCDEPLKQGIYAQWLCHELGHVNGWPPHPGE